MFIILAYDVNCKRVGKVNKICKKYLNVVQKSVFEGDITGAKLEKLKSEIENSIVSGEDSVCIYELDSNKYASKWQIGMVEIQDRII